MKLEINNISKKFGNNFVLESVNLSLTSGNIYGLWGKNGSGKTILLRIISGLVFPTSGEIVIDGKILGKDLSFPPDFGAMIENPGFIPGYSGFKNLKLLASIHHRITDAQIQNQMLQLGLDPNDSKKAKAYSLGMKQKLGICAALMEYPKLLLLDEPTNALDESSTALLKDILLERKKQGALILLSCHIREDLEYLSDEIICLENGKIVTHCHLNTQEKL